MQYWLLKSEPNTYSWKDLLNQPDQTDIWDGVRNYQARNFLRSMQPGDLAFFYHSVVKPQVIMGIVEIIGEPFPDPTQFDPTSPYFDPKASYENPRWTSVRVKAVSEFQPPITRDELKSIPELQSMVLLRKGSRLSVQPVTQKEWDTILHLRK